MIKVLELFGGIGACTEALKRDGIPFEVVDYVEIDKFAAASYNAINGTNFEPQDITKWDKDLDVDLIMHGSPCQDFSVAGKNKGGDKGSGTRSSLMYRTLEIVERESFLCNLGKCKEPAFKKASAQLRQLHRGDERPWLRQLLPSAQC